MTSFKKLGLMCMASLVFSNTASAQSAAVDPNEPMLGMLRSAELGELLPLKDHCLEKYPQLAASLETQLTAILKAMFGAGYAARVKKYEASPDAKDDRRISLISIRAWPDAVQSSRCTNLPPAVVYEAHVIAQFKVMAEKALPSAAHYVYVCDKLYPGEKFSQARLNEGIENLYGDGAQAQRKYAAFLAKPETQASLANDLKFFEETGWRRDDYRNQCFSNQRQANGVPLPSKVPAPAAASK